MTKQTVVAVCFGLVTSVAAWADQVTLANGDRVSGKLIQSEGSVLKMNTDLMGEVKIPWNAVISFNSEGPLAVVLSDGRVARGKVALNVKDQMLQIVTDAGVESPPIQELRAIRNEATQHQVERL